MSNPPAEPALMCHRKVAALCGVTPRNIRRWVERKRWPAPHATVERTMLYRVEDVEHFVRHGRWPDSMARPAK